MNYRSLQEWFDDLAKKESSGKYGAVNPLGYLGKYQMGEGALIDTGYYNKPSGKHNNDWSGSFTGKDDVYSKEDFLNKHQAQENAIREFQKKQWQYLKSNGSTKYVGSKINGIDITPSGLLAGAHLVGQAETIKYLKSNGSYIPRDGNKVSIEEYFKDLGGYDVSEIKDPNYYTPKWQLTNEEYVNRKTNQASNMISQVAQKVNPQSQISDNKLNEVPVPAPLSKEEWMKRLKRQRMGLQ